MEKNLLELLNFSVQYPEFIVYSFASCFAYKQQIYCAVPEFSLLSCCSCPFTSWTSTDGWWRSTETRGPPASTQSSWIAHLFAGVTWRPLTGSYTWSIDFCRQRYKDTFDQLPEHDRGPAAVSSTRSRNRLTSFSDRHDSFHLTRQRPSTMNSCSITLINSPRRI